MEGKELEEFLFGKNPIPISINKECFEIKYGKKA